MKRLPVYDQGGPVDPQYDSPPDPNAIGQYADPSAANAVASAPPDQQPELSTWGNIQNGLGQAQNMMGRVLGKSQSGEIPEAQTRMYPVEGLSAKVFDDGGVVQKDKNTDENSMGNAQWLAYRMNPLYPDRHLEPFLPPDPEMHTAPTAAHAQDVASQYGDMGTVASTVGQRPRTQKMNRDTVPIYDDGGPIKNDPNDGHHQLAIVEDGERVLTPEQNQQYEQEHAAVFPTIGAEKHLTQTNPPTEVQNSDEPLPADVPRGARMNINPYAEGTAKGTVGTAPDAKVEPPQMRTMSNTSVPQNKMAPVEGAMAGEGQPGGAPPGGEGGGGAGESTLNPLHTASSSNPLPHEREWLEGERSRLKQKMMDAAEGVHNGGKFDHVAYGEAKMALADLNRMHPWGQPENHPGILGKIGHGLGVAGNIAADALVPGVAPFIPGSRANLERQAAQGAEEVGMGQEAAKGQAEIQLKQAQARAYGLPKLVPGPDSSRLDPETGTRQKQYKYPDGRLVWVTEGELPPLEEEAFPQGVSQEAPPVRTNEPNPVVNGQVSQTPTTQAPPQEQVLPQQGLPQQPQKPAAPPVAPKPAAPVKTPRYVYGSGKPETTTPSPEDIAITKSAIQDAPFLPAQVKDDFLKVLDNNPSQATLNRLHEHINKLESESRAKSQEDFQHEMEKTRMEIAKMMADAHLLEMQQKAALTQQTARTTADQARLQDYSQQEYDTYMRNWQRSTTPGQYAKDVALITDQVNAEKSNPGHLFSYIAPLLSTTPAGAATVVGAEALAGALAGPVSGALDTLKKRGLSDQAYRAMQAYYNALPGRMAYEMSSAGVKAGAMRSQLLISKVLNTVPPPNTPPAQWSNAFGQYYKPMHTFIERMVSGMPVGKDYTPQTREDVYGPPSEGHYNHIARNKTTKEPAYSYDGKTWYDAKGNKLQ